jgi:hypothetical protein
MTIDTSFKLTNTTVRDLTRDYAEEFRKLPGSPTERPLDDRRVAHLKAKAEADQLVTFNWATVKLGDKVMRMNGQHSSTMLCALDGAFPAGLKVSLSEYEVQSREGCALLFRQFDDRKSNRTPSDVAGAYQGLYGEIRDVSRKEAKLGLEGMLWYRRVVLKQKVPSGDDQFSLFSDEENYAYLKWIGDLFTVKTPELLSPGVIGAMFASYEKNSSEAERFWSDVARGGVEYEDQAPATVLDKWLRAPLEGAREERPAKPPAPQLYQGCIYAWNAHRESKTIMSIKIDTRKGFSKVSE